MITHCMIDLETMSTYPNAVIVSIGAVAFNREEIIDDFYVNIDIVDSVAKGLHVQPETQAWWKEQSEEARKAVTVNPQSLLDALSAFSQWWRQAGCYTIWGNGADFDNAILKSNYQALDADPPYKPYVGRCYRTIKNLPGAPEMSERIGTHHNALDDAISQALHLLEIDRVLNVLE